MYIASYCCQFVDKLKHQEKHYGKNFMNGTLICLMKNLSWIQDTHGSKSTMKLETCFKNYNL